MKQARTFSQPRGPRSTPRHVAASRRVLVINPNSSATVTRDVADSISRAAPGDACTFECIGLAEGPPGIETQEHVDAVIPHIEKEIAASDFDAYILACFSDPGIASIRRATGKRVFGIGECAYLQAMSLGEKFGIISILPASSRRQLKYLEQLGFLGRLTASIPLGLGVAELASTETTRERMLAVGKELVSRGADVVILGCAGMAGYQQTLQHRLRVPVIEPTVAAVTLAAGAFHAL